ncbi:uncharacterized protein LOC108670851 [Hyalella azteca]|uniref:Uncharacterized protein LOC108670851 n=1 Tax=Hyalella azteca TaxID=294128 RepID=A0A8B7NJK2_HYAAZ|nr:uncharacterized protein LOC108670851 [Hyalella azteca]
MKDFIGVVFGDNSNSVVPKRWLTPGSSSSETKSCFWPSKNAHAKAKANAEPNSKWPTYNCRILTEASTFERCEKKMYTLTDGSTSADDEAAQPLIRPVPVLSFTPTSAPRKCIAQQCGTFPEEWMERIGSMIGELTNKIDRVEKNQNKLERHVSKHIAMAESKSLGATEALPAPATSMTELDNMAKDPNLIQKLQPYIGCNSKMTTRRLLKRCMSRDLALQFSFTGLGERRTATKQAFGGHLLCTRILGDAAALQMKDTREVLVSHIQTALRGARDWDGGRKLRLDAAASLSGVGSSTLPATASIDIVHGTVTTCTSPAGSTGGPRSPAFLPSDVFIHDIEGAGAGAETDAAIDELLSSSASERNENKSSSIGDENLSNDSSDS